MYSKSFVRIQILFRFYLKLMLHKTILTIVILLLQTLNVSGQWKKYTRTEFPGYLDRRRTGLDAGAYEKKMEHLDTVLVRIEYKVKWREVVGGELADDMEALYIGQHMSEFRENNFEFAREQARPDLTPEIYMSMTDEEAAYMSRNIRKIRQAYRWTNYTIQTNHPKEGLQKCLIWMAPDNVGMTNTQISPYQYYIEPIAQMEWSLEEGDSVVCSYNCQRASTSFRGRTWKVWYAPDLPYQDGPWKLCGLPGVILKAEDVDGDFFYEAIAITRPKDTHIVVHPTYNYYKESSFKRVKELTELRYKDPDAFWRLCIGNKIYEEIERSGQVPRFTWKKLSPCLIEKYE